MDVAIFESQATGTNVPIQEDVRFQRVWHTVFSRVPTFVGFWQLGVRNYHFNR